MATILQSLQIAGGVIAVLMGVGGIFGVLWCIGQMSALRSSVESLSTANGELRAELTDARRQLDDERRECGEKIAHIQGQMTAITSGLANQIVQAVVQAMASMVQGGQMNMAQQSNAAAARRKKA